MRSFLLLAFLPGLACAWSSPAADLARRAQAEFPGRIVVLSSLDEPAARVLPVEARLALADAQRQHFSGASTRGAITPFRHHWFDAVRCAIHVPPHENADDEYWAMAHEVGHCVARLGGWQETLWRQHDLAARHRSESWADAFALLSLPVADRARAAERALARRAQINDDAAYITEAAIGCALASSSGAQRLRRVGAQVEAQQSRPECLADPRRLQALDAFLASLQPR